jgi:hypothetical protein
MSDPASTPDDKAPEAAADAKPAAPSGGGLKSILISSTIMAVVLGGIGFALAYFVLPGRLAAAAPATTVATTGTNATANPSIPVPASGTEKTERSAAEIAATGGKVVSAPAFTSRLPSPCWKNWRRTGPAWSIRWARFFPPRRSMT